MTKLLDKALRAVRQLPPEAQDEIARTILQMAQVDREPEDIAPEHLREVLEGLAEARQEDYVTDKDVEAAFRRFDA